MTNTKQLFEREIATNALLFRCTLEQIVRYRQAKKFLNKTHSFSSEYAKSLLSCSFKFGPSTFDEFRKMTFFIHLIHNPFYKWIVVVRKHLQLIHCRHPIADNHGCKNGTW